MDQKPVVRSHYGPKAGGQEPLNGSEDVALARATSARVATATTQPPCWNSADLV